MLLVFLSACATSNSINKKYSTINYEDGIDKNEAIVIAQKQLLSSGYKKNYLIATYKVQKNDNNWGIAFIFDPVTLPKSPHFQTWYRVYIDNISGEIIDQGVYRGRGPSWGLRPFAEEFEQVVE